ncbi:hypothetical protein [Pseudalkalibacillus caeni]|uniref:Hydrolase n=1 Tax=Exobacillus caeni TaxID=2574798 RepID=A0A5R9FHI9_9BACL|nr:hypothetical protein [Pseudalkalibacillus caeni]TLS39035.1 hypothetical protein FCL54_01620 [Pseudalkalibacillus caeni]
MDKKRYYIAVGSGEILEDKTASSFEFEIEATEEDIIRLRELFDEADRDSRFSLYRAHVPGIGYHEDKNNDDYDRHIKEVYGMLHELGTPETKSHIDSMDIL